MRKKPLMLHLYIFSIVNINFNFIKINTNLKHMCFWPVLKIMLAQPKKRATKMGHNSMRYYITSHTFKPFHVWQSTLWRQQIVLYLSPLTCCKTVSNHNFIRTYIFATSMAVLKVMWKKMKITSIPGCLANLNCTININKHFLVVLKLDKNK